MGCIFIIYVTVLTYRQPPAKTHHLATPAYPFQKEDGPLQIIT